MVFAITSILGFVLRGYWMIQSSPLKEARVTRIAPHIVDTAFLLSGIAMLVATSTNPLQENWLMAKFVGLVVYIGLGTVALRRGKSLRIRAAAFLGAVICFGYIVGVALTKSPASWITALETGAGLVN